MRNIHSDPARCRHLCPPELSDTPRPAHSGSGSHRALSITSWGIRPGKGGFPSALTSAQPGRGPAAHTEPHVALLHIKPGSGRGGLTERGEASTSHLGPPSLLQEETKGVSPRPGCFPELGRGGRCVGRHGHPARRAGN